MERKEKYVVKRNNLGGYELGDYKDWMDPLGTFECLFRSVSRDGFENAHVSSFQMYPMTYIADNESNARERNNVRKEHRLFFMRQLKARFRCRILISNFLKLTSSFLAFFRENKRRERQNKPIFSLYMNAINRETKMQVSLLVILKKKVN